VAVREIHHVAAKEAVAKKAAAAALRKICHKAAMTTLESMAREAAKVVVRELFHGIAAEETHVADAAVMAGAWTLIDGNETEVEGGEAQERCATKEALVALCIATELEKRAAESSRAAMELLERHQTDELMASSAACAAVQLDMEEAEQALR
jgi:hypothetical protein